ncbi:MAG: chlorophyllase/cutinase-like alpha/beta fold protein, partial [Bacteroidota bacterium]
MKKFFKSLSRKLRKIRTSLSYYLLPGKKAALGAALGIFIGFALITIISSMLMAKYIGVLPSVLLILFVLSVSFLSAWLAIELLRLIAKIPFWLSVAIVAAIPGTMLFLHLNMPGTLLVLTFSLLSFGLVGGAILLIIKRWKKRNRLSRGIIAASLIIGSVLLVFSMVWLVQPGSHQPIPDNAAMSGDRIPAQLPIPDPSEKGSFPVLTLTYGSGLDKHRPEFGEDADLTTPSVDGSTFLSKWSGFSGKMRTRYFGFDNTELPLNAKVWYPDGTGPFPLVLVVHGNHLAQDYSDPGYEYLGKLLASRGYILASVDQNFLNGSYTNFFDGLSNENDARGWLLLKHLEAWQTWNNDPGHLFGGKADMNNIALIGHSRGGEAVAHAALFNNLPYYPDNANELFDFNFNIRSIVAIAPCDGQYQPTNERTRLKDVSYLVLQGSHDADVSSYQGMRQFNRIQFSDTFEGFKAGVYIWAANHGQFNTVWGNKDGPSPRINFFNLGQLLPLSEQLKISETYISAFLEATLKKNDAYRTFFKDYRTGRQWLPETVYITQYEQPGSSFIATFQEDFDLSTASIPGSIIVGTDLSEWREQKLSLNWGDYDSQAVVLGWNNKDNDTLQPSWCIKLPEGAINTNGQTTLTFAITELGKYTDPPRVKGQHDAGKNNSEEQVEENTVEENVDEEAGTDEENEGDENEEADEPDFIDFTIRLTDMEGRIVEFPLSAFA